MTFGDDELDTYSAIYERDVDVVLVMALRSSAAARALVCAAVGVPADPLLSVRHSLTTPDGREADVVLRTGESRRPHVVEIENKIDADFQPGQIESYRDRARASEASGDVSSARTLLLAPEGYLRTAGAVVELFHSTVSYEELRDCLRHESAWADEAALLIEHAIRQHRRGGRQSPTDDAKTTFFADFTARAEGRGLPHVPVIPRKSGAGFLWYPLEGTLVQPKGWHPGGSGGAWLVAKFDRGRADIELTRILEAIVDHESLLAALEQEPILFQAQPPRVVVHVQGEPIDLDMPIEGQMAEVDQLIECLVEARTWWDSRGRHLIERHLDR
jgi:hypothetical protein